ncbi:MAG: family 10 glycosylhydrolase [Clostridia bacterium]|nr:family 10 glycosylhydrolase [Clostridia bacterium]
MLGVWMWPESVRLRGAGPVFEDCRRAGITDVFFLTKGLSGTTAWPSLLAPPMDEERDLLGEALGAAHERGIRLHAWFTSASDAHYCREHPEAALCHFTKGPGQEVVSIADADYRRFMEELLADLLARYPLDGVHLDYIRYNHLLYGWSETDRAMIAEAGADLDRLDALMRATFYGDSPDREAIFDAYRAGDPDTKILAGVRRSNVLRFASALAGVVRDAGVTLSMALMPEGAYEDTAFADLHYGQDYGKLAEIADLLLPMAYSGAYGKDARWTAQVARGTVRCAAGRAKVMTGLHAYEGGTALTLKADRRAAERVEGTDGVCLFREGAFAWVWADGGQITLSNPTRRALTACTARRGNAVLTRSVAVEPGGTTELHLPFSPDEVRVFAGGEIPAVVVRTMTPEMRVDAPKNLKP